MSSKIRCSLNGILPQICLHCSKTVQNQQPICDICEQKLTQAFPVMPLKKESDIYVGVPYESVMKTLLHIIKFKCWSSTADWLGEQLINPGWQTFIGTYDVVLPVPLSSSRQRLRGFNQVTTLFEPFTRIASRNWEWATDWLGRNERPPLYHFDRSKRIQVLENAFYWKNYHNSSNPIPRILIVDDIMTTGATFEAMKHVLHAKSDQVDLLVLSYGDDDRAA